MPSSTALSSVLVPSLIVTLSPTDATS